MPPATGKIIFGEHLMGNFANMGFGAEIIYSFVIILCSLMIYFGTKELYELSSYKGIKYFRQAFLFFALAYFFRSFIKFVLAQFNVAGILDVSPNELGFAFGPLTLFVFMYFSSMAIFYLFYSVMYKKWEKNNLKVYLLHGLAILIALVSVVFNDPFVYFILNLILLFVFSYAVYNCHKTAKNKRSKLYVVYILLLIFWILNIIDVLIPNFLKAYQFFIYMASIGVFLLILYKVLRKVGN